MTKAAILDIDGVAFPMKKQFVKFIDVPEYRELLGDNLIDEFITSKASYISHYLAHLKTVNKEKYIQHVTNIKKKIKIKHNPFFKTPEENLTLHLLRQFGDTDYFIDGCEPMIKAMNLYFKFSTIANQEEVKIIGATSRGYPSNPNWIYNNCFERTNEWNEEHNSLFDKIYFKEHGKKITVLDDIKKDFGIDQEDILCMVEDSAYELEDFLKRGITGVFINEDKVYNAREKENLKRKYPKTFKIAQNHTKAKEEVLNLYNISTQTK